MKFSQYLATVVLLSAASTVYAEPTLYPQNINVLGAVVNQTDSNILADEVDPRTVWVLPPNTAEARVGNLHSKNANMGFCGEMKDLQADSRELSEQIKIVTQKKAAKLAELSALQQRASTLDEEAEKFAADKNLTALSTLDSHILDLENRLTELYKQAETCQTACDGINDEIQSIVASKRTAMKDRNDLARENTDDQREYTRKRKQADAAARTVVNARGVYEDIKKDLQTVQNEFRMQYATFGKMPGAAANFTYLSTWNANVQKLRDGNPGINFAKMPTKNAKLMTEISGVSNIDPQGSVLSIDVAGTAKDGAYPYPAYPESLTSNINLSLLGACPMEHPEYFDLKEDNVKDMKYGVIITYDYDSIFKVSASASYNMYKMYQKIVSSGSSGGLFSSRSWSNVEEQNFFRDSFVVKWEDRENVIPQEQKDLREQEMRHDILGRLASLALPNVPNRGEVLAAAQPPPRGAVVISDQLLQTCPGNAYCLAGAAVFRVLDAIFGSSSSNASYTNITDVLLQENYSNTQKITKSAITSYL